MVPVVAAARAEAVPDRPLGVLAAPALLVFLAYRGASVLLELLALLGVAFAAGTPLMACHTPVFTPAAGGFIVQSFPL